MKKKTMKIWLIAALIALAAMSFGPCITITRTARVDQEGLGFKEVFTEYGPFFPVLFCPVSAAELLLVILTKRKWFRGLGIALHLFKMAVPIEAYRSGAFALMGGLYSSTYALSWMGWLLMLVGAGVLVLYVWDLLTSAPNKT